MACEPLGHKEGVRARILMAAAAAALLLAGLAYLERQALAATAIELAASVVGHVRVGFATSHVTTHDAQFTGVSVRSPGGEPIATIDRLDVAYDLGDLLHGTRRFGLKSIDVDRPRITIVRHRDGTYNVPLHAFASKGSAQGAPLIVRARVRDGSLEAIDQGNVDPHQRHLYLERIDAVARLGAGNSARYTVTASYGQRPGRLYPIRGTGDVEPRAGYAMQRWSAPELPVAGAVDFALNSPSLHFASGTLFGTEARVVGVPGPNGTLESHLAATAYLSGARLAIGGLSKPVRDLHGRIDVFDEGLLAQRLEASIAGVPATISGGIYGMAAPQFRLAVSGRGDLSHLRNAFAQAAKLPLSGPLAFSVLVEGNVSKPLEWIAFDSPHAQYAAQAIGRSYGLVAFDGQEADAIDAHARVDGIDASVRGHATLAQKPNAIEMFVRASGSSAGIPYASLATAPMRLDAVALARSATPRAIGLSGWLQGRSRGASLDALFDVSPEGVGSIGPLVVRRGNGRLYARVALDRPHGNAGGVLDAHAIAIPFESTVLAGRFAGTERNGAIAVAGRGSARGAWGALDLGGTMSPRGGALAGRFDGSLAAASALGLHVAATGRVDAPVDVAYDGERALVSLHGARFTHASIAGIPVSQLDATLIASRRGVRVASAVARVGGGRALAAGSTAGGGRIGITAQDVGVASGRGSLGATLSGSLAAPRVAASFLVERARFRKLAVEAGGTASYAGRTLTLRSADARLGDAFVDARGRVGDIGTARAPSIDLDAALHTADAASLASLAGAGIPPVQGSVEANVRVTGTAQQPLFSGTIDAPEGTVNGLGFRDLHAGIAGRPGAVALRSGSVAVGSTAIAFAASTGGGSSTVSASAPHADLADFNDYFDAGDTFAGTGSLSLDAAFAGTQPVASSGRAYVVGAAFRRLALGTLSARWNGSRNGIATDLTFGGASGRVALGGTIDPAARTARMHVAADGLDLAAWLPMAGIQAPVTGKLDARATIAGRYPALDTNAVASIDDGTLGALPIERFAFAERGTQGRATIESAVLTVPGLTSTATGSFGLRPQDRLAIDVRSDSPDLGVLLQHATGKPWDLSGTLESDLRVTGSALHPQATDDVVLRSLRYGDATIARVAGRIGIDRTRATLSNGEIDLEPGRVLAGGSASLSAGGPIALVATLQGVGLGNAGSFFPKGTHVTGTLNGRVTVGGTRTRPHFGGSIALRDGSFIGPQERAPITAADATLAFAGSRATLRDLHAAVGGGSVRAWGWVQSPPLRSPAGLAFSLHARAQNAHVEMPAYFSGNIDAAVEASRAGAGAPIAVGGDVAVSSARIPLSALYNPGAKTGTAPALPPVAFDGLRVSAGRDVRVQSGAVDIGGTGAVTIHGSLAHPALAGAFHTTGGSIDFYHNFTLQHGEVSFEPSQGAVPYVDAVATTFLSDPPTDVRLHVTGPATQMNLALASDPPYDRQQILGLLLGVQQLGAVRGVAASNGASGGFTLAGSARNVALGQVNAAFMRNLLEPLSASLGSSLGFTDLQITSDLQSGLGLNAVKAFGKNVSAVVGESLGYPRTQSVALQAHPSAGTSLRLRLYTSDRPTLFGVQQPQPIGLDALELNPMTAIANPGGTNGFDFSYVRRFP